MYCSKCGNELPDNTLFCSNCGAKTDNADNCCLCGSTEMGEDEAILIVNKNGECKKICSKCSVQVENIETSSDNSTIKTAVGYLKSHLKNISDYDVSKYINDIIKKNEISDDDVGTVGNYIQSGSIWISGLRIVAWLLFAMVLIAGIIIGVLIGDVIGILIFFASIPLAFLSIAGLMTYLDIASDISVIKSELIKRK